MTPCVFPKSTSLNSLTVLSSRNFFYFYIPVKFPLLLLFLYPFWCSETLNLYNMQPWSLKRALWHIWLYYFCFSSNLLSFFFHLSLCLPASPPSGIASRWRQNHSNKNRHTWMVHISQGYQAKLLCDWKGQIIETSTFTIKFDTHVINTSPYFHSICLLNT